jgi:hypothetical protein
MRLLKKIIDFEKSFDYWFTVKFGWFFVNGRKIDRFNEKLKKRISDKELERNKNAQEKITLE